MGKTMQNAAPVTPSIRYGNICNLMSPIGFNGSKCDCNCLGGIGYKVRNTCLSFS